MLCRKCWCPVIFTYVYEVGPVLAGHAEAEIPPEPRVFLDYLQRKRPESLYTEIYQPNTLRSHFNTSMFLWAEHLAAGEGNTSEPYSDVAQQ